VVGRRHGPAAARNLFKRRVREAFRRHKDGIPRGWDVVVTPRSPEKGSKADRFPPAYSELLTDFLALLGAAAAPKP
jgi:ribonuclease P protein component